MKEPPFTLIEGIMALRREAGEAAVAAQKAPAYLPEGYKTKTKTWRVDGHPEAQNFQTEHFSGRLDAEVRPRPVRMRMRNEQD